MIIKEYLARRDCSLEDSGHNSHMLRYDRQILIENWDQTKIKDSKVVIIGMGALGTIVGASLAMAGVGHLLLVDFDTIEFSNLNRQLLFHIEDVGESKVSIAERELKNINPDLKVTSLDMKVQNVPSAELESATVIIEGLDTFRDRRWVNSFVVEKEIPLVSGGLFGFLGNLQVVIPHKSACLECQSLIPEEELQKACTPFGDVRKKERKNESELEEKIPAVSSVSFVIGGLMAQETMKIILGLPPIKEYLFWDGTSGIFTSLELSKRDDCFVCSSKFQLEAIKEALRVTANIHDSRNKNKKGETCHDRMVRQAEKYAENALKGEKDIEVRYI